MKRGHDLKANLKHRILVLSKEERELAETMPFDEYMAQTDKSSELARNTGMWKWWLNHAVK